MLLDTSLYMTKIARTDQELRAAQRLRYEVFVQEMGASTNDAGRKSGLEADAFDPYFDHLLLIDQRNPDPDTNVVGVYRLMLDTAARAGIGFYSAAEYDLGLIEGSGRKALELGRSCLHKDHRGGVALGLMWQALAVYVQEKQIEILFGVASFHGTDLNAVSHALSHLHYNHSAPAELQVSALGQTAAPMNVLPKEKVDKRLAMQQMPSLIKAYLRLGGVVGQDAFVDHEFNTIDICLIMDTQRMTTASKERYQKGLK